MQKYIELFKQKYRGVKSLEEIISISEHELKFQTQKLKGEERRRRRKMPKPIKSQEAHDKRFNADKENFRQKYGRMSLEEIAECGKVRGCTPEYCKGYAKGVKTHKELYKLKNGGKSLEEIAQSSKRILSRDKWGRKDENI